MAVDSLSALFLLIIAVSGMATVLYSRGYLQGYLAEKSSAHISLHYVSLTILVLSMMMVVMSSGGFSFLLSWEAHDHRLVPAHTVRRPTRRGAARRADIPYNDAHRLRLSRGGLRRHIRRVRFGALRRSARMLRDGTRHTAVPALSGGLRHEGGSVPDARLAARGTPRRLRRTCRP